MRTVCTGTMTSYPTPPSSSLPKDIQQRRIPTLLGTINVHISNNGVMDSKRTTLVFWPSLVMNGLMFYPQMAHFSSSYNCISIDGPGHGASSPLTSHFTLEECCVVLRQILDALDVQKPILFVGNSWGGMMGGCFAAFYPNRIQGAILMNSTASPVPLYQKYNYYALTAVMRIMRGMPSFMLPVAVDAFTGPMTRRTQPEVVEYIKQTVLRNNERYMSIVYAIESVVPMRRDMHQLHGAVQCPVLVLAGDEDATFPVAETKRQADSIPGAQFRVLNGIAHLMSVEQPDRINQQIEQFIQSLQ